MRIEILRPVMISGESVAAGSFIEVSESDANLLIGSGKAIAAAPAPAPTPVVAAEEPKPKRRAKVAAECKLPTED
jgi:hypothetical protein